MSRLRGLAILMGIVILAITGFQGYWLRDNYTREAKTLESRTDGLFREAIREMKDASLQHKIQRVLVDTPRSAAIRSGKMYRENRNGTNANDKETARFINILGKTLRNDSAKLKPAKNKGMYLRITGSKSWDSVGRQGNINLDSLNPDDIKEVVVVNSLRTPGSESENVDSLGFRSRVGLEKSMIISHSVTLKDSAKRKRSPQINTIYFNNEKGGRVILRLDSLINDSIPLQKIESEFAGILKREKLEVPFSVLRLPADSAQQDELFPANSFGPEPGYKLQLGSTYPYLIKRISWPIVFSFFLVGITIFSFILLYRNLLRQHRLGQMKNDLISNITHELKTPIATVGVAIEALKNFNAINDPEKTKEYLDISQSELQRLGLLVDKVLKLSMFENKKIEIKHEVFKLDELVNEVVSSFRLQAEKYKARISIVSGDDTTMRGDRMHLLSVIFNLLDNAMKYSKDNASIQIETKSIADSIILGITDNGIGIAAAYKEKIFEKFFRVPTGDTHNAKGHGLGLSYVAQVIRQHGGTIDLNSREGIGSTFTITLPK